MNGAILKKATLTVNGTTYELWPAIIESTTLGYEDHGIFTGWLHLDYGGSGQGAGGYFLDRPGDDKRRVGTAYGLDWVIRVIEVVGVESWERLKGQRVYALRSGNGLVDGIASWLAPAKHHFLFREHAAAWEKERES